MGRLTETIEIAGMTCGKCAYHVRQALQGVQGVEVENVEIGSAEISYDPENISRLTIIMTIIDPELVRLIVVIQKLPGRYNNTGLSSRTERSEVRDLAGAYTYYQTLLRDVSRCST